MKKLTNTILVIFGITGDLSKRKLLPALYNLERAGLLPEGFRIVGVSRKGTEPRDIIRMLKQSEAGKQADCPDICEKLEKTLSIVDMKLDEGDTYAGLSRELSRIEAEAGRPLNRLFYLAIPASLFPKVTERLAEADLNMHESGIRESRYLIEKPFGADLASAKKLISDLNERFGEERIFRIDHYLAKETVQNILSFRFSNPLFNGAWNNRHISHIMVTASESIGIEGRTAFYEGMGAMRDLVQSHLLQLLALATMEKPKTMEAAEIHREKEKILAAIRPPEPERMKEETVRAQYRTYREETGIADSLTETYAAVRLSIDTPEWKGVPMFIRTGKALKEKVTEITVVFTEGGAESLTSARADAAGAEIKRNYLTLRIQPNEGIAVDLDIKKPGLDEATQAVQLDFCYRDAPGFEQIDAYARVLYDGMRGDRTLFATGDEVLACWRITEPVLRAWDSPDFPLHFYDNGSAGPEAADELIQKTGIAWFTDSHQVCTPPKPSFR
ncbi:MAG: glucose-6-phosphate dehydrogenase [Spirochaetales bacterium]|nr:glucose-6-phosphate dehydrogenase [Spirochaetales bacterium]